MQKYRVEVDDEGTIRWYKYDTSELHRVDGPAVEYVDGYKSYYLNGLLNRTDGPAIERADGTKLYYLNGQGLTKEEWEQRVKPPTCDGKIVEIEGKKYKLVEV